MRRKDISILASKSLSGIGRTSGSSVRKSESRKTKSVTASVPLKEATRLCRVESSLERSVKL